MTAAVDAQTGTSLRDLIIGAGLAFLAQFVIFGLRSRAERRSDLWDARRLAYAELQGVVHDLLDSSAEHTTLYEWATEVEHSKHWKAFVRVNQQLDMIAPTKVLHATEQFSGEIRTVLDHVLRREGADAKSTAEAVAKARLKLTGALSRDRGVKGFRVLRWVQRPRFSSES